MLFISRPLLFIRCTSAVPEHLTHPKEMSRLSPFCQTSLPLGHRTTTCWAKHGKQNEATNASKQLIRFIAASLAAARVLSALELPDGTRATNPELSSPAATAKMTPESNHTGLAPGAFAHRSCVESLALVLRPDTPNFLFAVPGSTLTGICQGKEPRMARMR